MACSRCSTGARRDCAPFAGVSAGPTWRERARAAAAEPPPRPREPLHLEVDRSTVLVGSIEPALAERMHAAALPIRRAAGGWTVAAPAVPSLAAIAGWLRDAGVAGRWRDELL